MIRVGVLGSTRGTALLPIIAAINDKRLAAEIVLVVSNKADALILERAQAAQIPTALQLATGLNREAYDAKLTHLFQMAHVDVILLIGYMRILSCRFVTTWKDRLLNIHPSLLPDFAGKMDLEVHEAVLAAKRYESGCTVHFVTEEVDQGPILLQRKCMVDPQVDTPLTLKSRVQALEGEALIEALHTLERNQLDNHTD